MTILKYKIDIINRPFKIWLPEQFKPLSFQPQDENLQMWGLGDLKNNLVQKLFICIGTGLTIHDLESMNYVGTAQQDGYVWHLFYE